MEVSGLGGERVGGLGIEEDRPPVLLGIKALKRTGPRSS